MGASDVPLLAALLAPLPVSEFLDRHWPDVPLEVHGTPARLPPLLRDPALASSVTLAQRYGGRLRYTHGGSDRMLLAGEGGAASLLDMGLTVQFVDLESCVQGVAAFCRKLEGELGLHEGAVALSAFATAREGGLACHYDAAELISVQLLGNKRFHYAPVDEVRSPCGSQYAPHTAPFDDLYPQATAGFPQPAAASFAVADMRPGSLLFLPRGHWHHTSATEDSLSVSIAIDAPPALRNLLDQLRGVLLQDPRWRRPLYAHAGRDSARRRAQELLATLPALVARVGPDDLVDAPLRGDARIAGIGEATRFQRTPQGRIEIGAPRAGGNLPLRFSTGSRPFLAREIGDLEISPETAPLLRWIEARRDGPFTFGQAAAAHPRVHPAALRDILRLCAQGQYVRVLWYPALQA